MGDNGTLSTYWTGLTGFSGYFVCCFQFPDEIENTKSLREEGSIGLILLILSNIR